MKYLVASTAALRELASGIALEAVGDSATLHLIEREDALYVVAAGDREDSQRVVICRQDFRGESLVPSHLKGRRGEVLGRIASFAERARTLPLALPRGWHPFKLNNLASFFASGNPDEGSTRWIAEVTQSANNAVIFWRATTAANKTELEEFAAEAQVLPSTVLAGWGTAFTEAMTYFDHLARDSSGQVDMFLPAIETSGPQDQTLDGWLGAATTEQRAFIEASTEQAIRLRGPAGSGKTLAITLKAVREAVLGREKGDEPRILIVTHSWALATQIANNIDKLGLGTLPEIDVFPLLALAQSLAPQTTHAGSDLVVIGDDSFSGKRAQLDQVIEVVREFVASDWITYRSTTSEGLRARLDTNDPSAQLALCWDLLVEFGSVIGAAGIFPGAGSEARYMHTARSSWMMPVSEPGDLRVIFKLYERYMENLDQRSLVTSDQVLADFLGYLTGHAWNRGRRSVGYDLVFVDEFHLFSPLERQVLHFLTRDVERYPRIFMALDPRQSPSEAFIGGAADETQSQATSNAMDDGFGDVTNLELTSVHRFTPQILDLIKHVHLEFPTLELGEDWDIDFSRVESVKSSGSIPKLVVSGTRDSETNDLVNAVHDLYPRGRVAIAVVDTRHWPRYSDLAATMGRSGKFHVSGITSRSEIEGVGYRKKGLVVGSAEYLAGLQFDSVLVAGLSDMATNSMPAHEKRRLLSLLYLAISRAESEVRIFTNEDDGGVADVLARAVSVGVVERVQGTLL
ncbi:UvrD-helicase domain-containing protein [Microbacterium lushaniae]|uniref:DEAD/DEAH box helicase n=1 Tax=Microbacterium lushaniae TaxID=2614639 RepID=A0A5J6L4Z6_9MICO|nr:UvrD-helicase domain-containing protein [Microbacterium lushaniae]QEW03624.1 DEAD/DEAH box helicase [Microbacterium lushaniae]